MGGCVLDSPELGSDALGRAFVNMVMEVPSSTKCKEFLRQFRNYQLLTTNSSPPSQQHLCYTRAPFVP
jgi:hypothetical protein